MIAASLSQNAWYAVPGGYPLRLWPGGHKSVSGVLPVGFSTVTATVSAEPGCKVDVYLGLYAMPSTVNGSDGAEVALSTALSVGAQATTTIAVSVPSSTSAPVPYVVRLECRNFVGTSAESISRDGTTAAALLPGVPLGLSLVSLVAS